MSGACRRLTGSDWHSFVLLFSDQCGSGDAVVRGLAQSRDADWGVWGVLSFSQGIYSYYHHRFILCTDCVVCGCSFVTMVILFVPSCEGASHVCCWQSKAGVVILLCISLTSVGRPILRIWRICCSGTGRYFHSLLHFFPQMHHNVKYP